MTEFDRIIESGTKDEIAAAYNATLRTYQANKNANANKVTLTNLRNDLRALKAAHEAAK